MRCLPASALAIRIARGWGISRLQPSMGDTLVLWNRGGVDWPESSPIMVDSITVLWRSADLVRPAVIREWGDEAWLVAGRTSIFIIDRAGRTQRQFGGEGEGPGEFMYIAGVHAWGTDSLLVLDRRRRRLTWLDNEGIELHSRLLPPAPAPGTAPFPSDLVVFDNSVFLHWGPGMGGTGVPLPHALTWLDLETDSLHMVVLLHEEGLVEVGYYVLPQRLFGERALIAVAGSGDVAYGNGLEYCVVVESHSGQHRRICREYTRIPVTSEVKNPDFAVLRQVEGFTERSEAFLQQRLRAQEFPELRNSIDAIRFDTQGRLWIRVVNENYRFDEMLMNRYADLRPGTFTWDLFARDGRRLAEVYVDSKFDPLLIMESSMVGAYELATGEIVVGHARFSTPPVSGTIEQ